MQSGSYLCSHLIASLEFTAKIFSGGCQSAWFCKMVRLIHGDEVGLWMANNLEEFISPLVSKTVCFCLLVAGQ